MAALTGNWLGNYTCAQGLNQVLLQINAQSSQNVTALMKFAVPNSQPGSYYMRGTFAPQSRANHAGLCRMAEPAAGIYCGQHGGRGRFSAWNDCREGTAAFVRRILHSKAVTSPKGKRCSHDWNPDRELSH